MDHAERGTVEKTLDELIEDSQLRDSILKVINDAIADQQELTGDDDVLLTGIVTGILTTIRTYSDGEAGIETDDVEEILKIVQRRQPELIDTTTATVNHE